MATQAITATGLDKRPSLFSSISRLLKPAGEGDRQSFVLLAQSTSSLKSILGFDSRKTPVVRVESRLVCPRPGSSIPCH